MNQHDKQEAEAIAKYFLEASAEQLELRSRIAAALSKAREDTWDRVIYLAKAEAFERRNAECVVAALIAARAEDCGEK